MKWKLNAGERFLDDRILKQGQVETNSGCELRREFGYLQNYPRVFVLELI